MNFLQDKYGCKLPKTPYLKGLFYAQMWKRKEASQIKKFVEYLFTAILSA